MYLWFRKKAPLIVVMTTWKHSFMLVARGYTFTFKWTRAITKAMKIMIQRLGVNSRLQA